MSKWHVNPYSSVEENEWKEMESFWGGGGGFSGTFFLSLYCRVVLGWLCNMSGREVGCDTWLQCFNSFKFYRVHYIFFVFVSWILLKNIKMFFSFKLWKVELYSTTSLSPFSCSGNYFQSYDLRNESYKCIMNIVLKYECYFKSIWMV